MTAAEKVQALLDAANGTTGESDADLTTAVGSLIDGYGQGGAATQEELDSIAEGIGVATPSTPASIESAVDELIADANAATGEADETLTDAVGTLIDAMPSGSISITENGTVDVATFASALVNVPSGETFPTYTASVACEVMSEVSAWVRTLGLTRGFLVAKNAPAVNQVYCGGAVENGIDFEGFRINNGVFSAVIVNDSRYGGIIHIGTEFIFVEVGVQ